MRHVPTLLVLLVFIIGGCAGSSVGSDSYYTLDMSEVEGANAYDDALDVVTSLRPNWFENSAPTVYVNDERLAGGLSALSTYPAEQIVRFRFYPDHAQKPEFVITPSKAVLVVITEEA